jgi:hypothetical protein
MLIDEYRYVRYDDRSADQSHITRRATRKAHLNHFVASSLVKACTEPLSNRERKLLVDLCRPPITPDDSFFGELSANVQFFHQGDRRRGWMLAAALATCRGVRIKNQDLARAQGGSQ